MIWRQRMQDLSRNVGKPHPPLFAPLTLAASAQIEAISVDEMVLDATRLRKNVSEMRRVLGLDAVVCAVPSAMERECVGAMVTSDSHPRLAASLEVVRQIASADASQPVLVTALTGPATLLAQRRAADAGIDSETGYDAIGIALASLTRLYAEAGIHVLQLHESVLPDEADIDYWKGALGTAGNVARFHRVPPLLVMDSAPLPWPAQMVACPTHVQHADAMPRAHGRAWRADPAAWPRLPGDNASERYVTTVADLPADMPVATIKSWVDGCR
jgi:hypothetical protein